MNLYSSIKRIRIVATILFSLVVSASCDSSRATKPKSVPDNQQEMFSLLHQWCEGLLSRQIQHEDSLLDGGILCPACVLMHGRTPDAIYPFLYVASRTGDTRFVEASKRLLLWGRRTVRLADGSWNNEVNMYTWRGITVFGLITLGESLRDFSYLLDQPTRRQWMESLKEQADFIASYIQPGVGNINYSATACYALALAGEVSGEEQYIGRAKELASLVSSYFTECDSLYYGEGVYPYVKSAKGLWPVDLGYNVEETLPNLLFYADWAKDEKLKTSILTSIYRQLEFMLPDGAWDNSWGTRNFKWSYWGSRTSDGVVSLCSILGQEDSLFATVGYRNVELLKQCTHQGLLYGGMHYRSAGYPACIHHTFEHAKGLAVALHRGFGTPEKRQALPREKSYGARYFRDLDSWLVATGDWRATVSGYDVGYKMPGGNCHGGTLSMLWHRELGPILAAAMTHYTVEEPANMQLLRGEHNYSPTFQVRYHEEGKVYSNAYCKRSEIVRRAVDGGEVLTIITELVDITSNSPASGKIPVEIVYEFYADRISVRAKSQAADKREVELYLPVISQADEAYQVGEHNLRLSRDEKELCISTLNSFDLLPMEKNGRAFCPVPGFEFIPLTVRGRELEVSISVAIED